MTSPSLSAIAKRVDRIETATIERDEAIRAAFCERDGFTVEDIADAAGLSRARIYQIVEEASP